MKFLKENSYDIVRLFINQIGITIFSIVVYLPAMVSLSDKPELSSKVVFAISAFATLFYLILLYNTSWEYGSKDRMRADSGKITLFKPKGLIMSVIANIPNFLLSGLAIILIVVYMTLGNDGAYTAFGIFSSLTRFLSSMYIGMLQGIFSFLSSNAVEYLLWQTVGYFVLPIASVIVSHVGYTVGIHHIKISSLLGFNKAKK